MYRRAAPFNSHSRRRSVEFTCGVTIRLVRSADLYSNGVIRFLIAKFLRLAGNDMAADRNINARFATDQLKDQSFRCQVNKL